MRRLPGKTEADEGREWWAVFAAGAFFVALYLLFGLFKDVTTSTSKQPDTCNNTAQGAKLVTDDRGYLCRLSQLDADTGCCAAGDRYACPSCNLTAQCCATYEPCVSCCLDPTTLQRRIDTVLDSSVNPILLRSAGNAFGSVYSHLRRLRSTEFCRSLCRTSSDSVVGENRYRSELKYCYGGDPQPSGLSMLIAETERGASNAPSAPNSKRTTTPTISVDPPAPRGKTQPQQFFVSAEGVAQASSAAVLGFNLLWLLTISSLLLVVVFR